MNRPARYRIQVEGRLNQCWEGYFDGMNLSTSIAENGLVVTTLTGAVADDTALHGLLSRIRDLGLHLVLVQRLDEPESAHTPFS